MAEADLQSKQSVIIIVNKLPSEREKEVVSILDRLNGPSDVSRKRKLSINTGGNRRATSASSTSPSKAYEPKISARQRPKEFKGKTLKVIIDSARSALFCQSCKEEAMVKKSNLISHISKLSKKHKLNK